MLAHIKMLPGYYLSIRAVTAIIDEEIHDEEQFKESSNIYMTVLVYFHILI
jgi:hypothetical protein